MAWAGHILERNRTTATVGHAKCGLLHCWGRFCSRVLVPASTHKFPNWENTATYREGKLHEKLQENGKRENTHFTRMMYH